MPFTQTVFPAIGCRLTSADAAQTAANVTYTAIKFELESFDTSGFHDTSSSGTPVTNTKITIPAGLGGKYLIGGQCGIEANASGVRFLKMMKNGASDLQYSAMEGTTGIENIMNIIGIAELAAGDYIQLLLYQSSGSTLLNNNNGRGIFFAFYLGP